MELEESTFLTSDYTTKLQSTRQLRFSNAWVEAGFSPRGSVVFPPSALSLAPIPCLLELSFILLRHSHFLALSKSPLKLFCLFLVFFSFLECLSHLFSPVYILQNPSIFFWMNPSQGTLVLTDLWPQSWGPTDQHLLVLRWCQIF